MSLDSIARNYNDDLDLGIFACSVWEKKQVDSAKNVNW